MPKDFYKKIKDPNYREYAHAMEFFAQLGELEHEPENKDLLNEYLECERRNEEMMKESDSSQEE